MFRNTMKYLIDNTIKRGQLNAMRARVNCSSRRQSDVVSRCFNYYLILFPDPGHTEFFVML